MMRLPVCVPLHNGETALSFASRLAAAMGAVSMRAFCRHIAIAFDRLLQSDVQAIERLAALGGVDAAELLRHSLMPIDGHFEINGQKLTKNDTKASILFGCPCCLVDDIERGDGPLATRPYLRSSWLVRLTRACPTHCVPLIELGSGLETYISQDVAAIARHAPDRLRKLAAESSILPASGLADYLQVRLLSGDGGLPFLDSLPFYVAIRLTEMIGASITAGSRFNLRNPSNSEWWSAGREGFAVTQLGAEGFQRFLTSRVASFWKSDRAAGGVTIHGTLYSWLQARGNATDFASVRTMIREHAVDNLPLGKGDNFLGPITSRRWHSIHSAAMEYGIHPKRLRKQLAAKGILSLDHSDRTDDRTLFEAESAAPFLTELTSSMSADEASKHGGISRSVWDLLVRHGLIQPLVGGDRSYAVFAKDDIDGFIQCLSRMASSSKPTRIGLLSKMAMMSISSAARCANCTIIEIVRLLLEGELHAVAINEEAYGFSAILVRVDEVQRKTARPERQGLSLRNVEQRLRTTTATVKALVENGCLQALTVTNPVSRCAQTVVMPDVLKTFEERYVSLSRLAAERRMQIAALKRELDEAGVEPAFYIGEKAARFYERSGVGSALIR